MVDEQHNAEQRQFVLRPNQSIAWRDLKRFFLGLCVVSFAVAGVLSLFGYWPILTFAGLEMLAVGAALYLVARRGRRVEVISIDQQLIRVERGFDSPQHQWEFPTLWAQLVLECCPNRWYPSRLLIRSHGRSVEIGSFLNEAERQYLAKAIRRDLGQAEGRRFIHRSNRSTNNDQSLD